MADDTIDFRSVNWVEGLFLTPEHFVREERYVDSLFLWLARYAVSSFGLVGGGPRVEQSERGAARFDPIVDIDDDGETLRVTITQARGITPGGLPVEVVPSHPVRASFSKKELEGTKELGIYVVTRPYARVADDSSFDRANPQVAADRLPDLQVQVEVQADEVQWSLLTTRLQRASEGLKFEKIPGFIPACAFMSSHSELMSWFRRLNESVSSAAGRYAELHRAIVDFMTIAQARGIAVDQDRETLMFVSRTLVALESCAYEIIDPQQSPARFAQQMRRLIRSAALFLSLSPPTREYFKLLGEIGEVEFVTMLEQEHRALQLERQTSSQDNLRTDMEEAARGLDRLVRLEQALEGKYMDYRVSPSLENINFVFDRTTGEPVLFKAVAKPARPQAMGQELTLVFSPLRLEGRDMYRLILLGDKLARFLPGDRLAVELRINPGSGYNRPPLYLSADYEVDGQRNFAVDFRAPDDVVSINDIRVSLRSEQPIRGGMLYTRGRLTVGSRLSAAVESGPPADSPPRAATREPAGRPPMPQAPPAQQFPPREEAAPARRPAQPPPVPDPRWPAAQEPRPADPSDRRGPEDEPPPPRRRRLL